MSKNVSCIIVNYNDWERTLSLTKNIIDYSCISHVIVVNNSSTDSSISNLKGFNHPKYILIDSDYNGGYGYGNNLGIRKAYELADEYFLIANPDVLFSEQCLIHMLNTIEIIDGCAALGAKETYIGTYGWKYTSGLHDVLSTSLLFNRVFKKRYYPSDYFENKEWVYIDIIPGCFMLANTSVMYELGMYDERFFLYEEEKVIYKKLSDSGYKLAIDLMQSFEHRHVDGKLTISKCLKTKKHLIKSKRIFLREYRRFNRIQLLLSNLFFVFCFIEMFFYSLFKCRG